MASSITITGDDLVIYHGNSISTPPRDWYGTAGSMVDRIAAANPGPRGGPFYPGTPSGSAPIVSGSVGFQRGSKKSSMPQWLRVSASGQSILAMTPATIIPYNPDVIFHETQANDEQQGPDGTGAITPAIYETAMRSYIDTMLAWKPSLRIVWIGVWSLQENYDLAPLRWHTDSLPFRAIDIQVCSEHANVVFADIQAAHINLLTGLYGPWPATGIPYTDDGLHPSEPTGKLAYCDAVMPYIRFQP